MPINTGITLARSAGLLRFDPDSPDTLPADRRRADGKTEHQVLFDMWVHEGLEKLERFPERPGRLGDPDDLDRNTDGFNAPSPDEPLRATRYDDQGRPVAGVRFAYLRPAQAGACPGRCQVIRCDSGSDPARCHVGYELSTS